MASRDHTTPGDATEAAASGTPDKIAALFDEDLSYSIILTRLVDGESTYTLTVERELIGEFPGYDEASERLREIKFARRADAVRQIMQEALTATQDELCEALAELVWIIDRAGLHNLSRGVELGQTSWYVKASDRLDAARAALAKARGEA